MTTKLKADLLMPIPAAVLAGDDIVAEACFVDHGCDGWHEKGIIVMWRDGDWTHAVLFDDFGLRAPRSWQAEDFLHVLGPRRTGRF